MKVWVLSRDGSAAQEAVHQKQTFTTQEAANEAAKRLIKEEGGDLTELLEDGHTEDARCCAITLDEVEVKGKRKIRKGSDA